MSSVLLVLLPFLLLQGIVQIINFNTSFASNGLGSITSGSPVTYKSTAIKSDKKIMAVNTIYASNS